MTNNFINPKSTTTGFGLGAAAGTAAKPVDISEE